MEAALRANPARDALAGFTVSLAMVPETVAFALVAGLNPVVGLIASAVGGVVTALAGGRPGMISGGAGSLAVVCGGAVAKHGPTHLFAAAIAMGVLQVGVGLARWGKWVRLVPHPVMLGFVNGLALVIAYAQWKELGFRPELGFVQTAEFWEDVGLALLTAGIALGLPRVTRLLPSALVAIGATSALVAVWGIHVPRVGDVGRMSGRLPLPGFPSPVGPWGEVAALAVILAGIGLTETLLTQQVVDARIGGPSDPDRECVGQGVANVASGLFGGMGVCAMIAQSILNVESGGRTRLSGVVEGLSVLVFLVAASRFIEAIPLAALIGVMMVVVVKTFAWPSLRLFGRAPNSDLVVIATVTFATVAVNLFFAVLLGVAISAVVFAARAADRLEVVRSEDGVYAVRGHLFFGTAQAFAASFRPDEDPAEAVVDLSRARVEDLSGVEAIADVRRAYAARGRRLRLRDPDGRCAGLLGRAGIPLEGPSAV